MTENHLALQQSPQCAWGQEGGKAPSVCQLSGMRSGEFLQEVAWTRGSIRPLLVERNFQNRLVMRPAEGTVGPAQILLMFPPGPRAGESVHAQTAASPGLWSGRGTPFLFLFQV